MTDLDERLKTRVMLAVRDELVQLGAGALARPVLAAAVSAFGEEAAERASGEKAPLKTATHCPDAMPSLNEVLDATTEAIGAGIFDRDAPAVGVMVLTGYPSGAVIRAGFVEEPYLVCRLMYAAAAWVGAQLREARLVEDPAVLFEVVQDLIRAYGEGLGDSLGVGGLGELADALVPFVVPAPPSEEMH